jgi:hypothetical protein
MNWPQWVVLGLLCVNVAVTTALHGRDRTGKHDAGWALFGFILNYWLLWMGGFWG